MKAFLLATAISILPATAIAQDFGLSGPAQIEAETLGAAQDLTQGCYKTAH